MVILTTTYNCENFVEKSLVSIMTQRFTDFKCYITDDLSTDNTVEVIKKTISGDDRFVLIENKTKMYQPGNYDQVIRGLDIHDDEICVEVDGDDWLPNSNVFGLINETYSDPDVWMTSGSFKYSNGAQGASLRGDHRATTAPSPPLAVAPDAAGADRGWGGPPGVVARLRDQAPLPLERWARRRRAQRQEAAAPRRGRGPGASCTSLCGRPSPWA